MAIPIQFDAANVPLLPHLILATKSGVPIRELPISDVKFYETLTGGSEFSFVVYREACLNEDGEIDETFWAGITDLRLAYCRDYDQWYELKVDRTESNDILKTATARSLGEAELSQINVYGIEVNTETDIERDDYRPTVLYNADKNISLIDRLLYKAPHYSVKHVDDSIKDIQRTFSFDGKTIYDCFNEVSSEIGCLFLYESSMKEGGGIDREISVYDLEYHCPVCGLRGEYMPICENCGYETVPGYGLDTKIFVARENLAKEITYTTNTDAVKNCFRLQAGDDLMTAGVIACNPNGSQYIWYITDEMKADMSQALQNRLTSYDTLYEYYLHTATFSPPADLRTAYNTLVHKYQAYRSDLQEMPATLTGYPAMMNAYFDTIDFRLFLESELMPSVDISTTTAAIELSHLTAANLSPVAVAKLSTCTAATADSAVLGMAKCLVRGTCQVKVASSSYNTSTHVWTGKLTVTNYGDEEDTATHASNISIVVNENLERYIQQKIDKMINQTEDDPTDISALFKLELTPFTSELRKYCRNRLSAFRDACQAALDILIQQGAADNVSWAGTGQDLYSNMYVPYKNKMAAIEAELATRVSEIRTVAGEYDENGGLLTHGMESRLKDHIDEIREALDFEAYLGTECWEEFASYRREDVYQNDNYISDGLNNYELMVNAQLFLNNARKEIFKSATMQHSISASLNNLLVMEEFQPIVKLFQVGSWIRIKSDGKVYRLRLSEYTIDYSSWNLDVVFTDLKQGYNAASDLQYLLNSLKSIQTSYGNVARQAASGEQGKDIMDRWVEEGLALTMNIVGGARNQEFVMDETGFTGKELIEETGTYSPEQIKIISHGIYMTDNNWITAKAGLGRFRFWNPQTGQEEDAFGVIADKLVGNLVLTEEVGVYNKAGSVTLDKDGFTLITNATNNQTVFTIKKKNANNTYTDLVKIDSNGNVVLNAYSTTEDMNTAISVAGEGILANVSQTLQSYSTTTQMNTAISASAQGVLSTVSQNYCSNETASSMQSSISQNATAITTKVSKDGVISSINQSSESVTISAGKINLSGYVTVSSLGANGSTTVNGSRIQGGTIVLGGYGNGNGVLQIKSANNNTIGEWDKDGLRVYAGSIEGTTITGSDISGGTIDGTTISGSKIVFNGSIYGQKCELKSWISTGNASGYIMSTISANTGYGYIILEADSGYSSHDIILFGNSSGIRIQSNDCTIEVNEDNIDISYYSLSTYSGYAMTINKRGITFYKESGGRTTLERWS